MLARSVRNPLIITVGAGVVLASSTASAALAATTPTPTPRTSPGSPSATPTKSQTTDPNPTPTETTPPPLAVLQLKFASVPSTVAPGAKASMEVVVTPSGGSIKNLELTLTADRGAAPTSVSSGKSVYKTATLSGSRHVAMSVAIPSKVTSGKVTVTAYAVGDDAKSGGDVKEVSKAQALTVKKPKSSSSSSSGSSGGSSGSSSSGSSGSSSETSSASDLPVGSGSSTTTSPTGNPAVLPSIAPQQTPSTAPGPVVENTGATQSMRGTADDADQLTFDKLASTQAAWLAALLVAFSLLLTQIRLGRAAAAKDPRAKGAHRRTRRTNGAH